MRDESITTYATLDAEGYVCEGNLRTGPFESWEEAVRWFQQEFEITLEKKAAQ